VGKNFPCLFKFIKINSQVPFSLPFETQSIDVITMNSVLHHIQDTNTFLREVDRILKPKSLLFIAHEPNKYFYDHKFLRYNYIFVEHLINPKILVTKVLRKIRLEKVVKKVYYFIFPKKKKTALELEEIAHKINDVLYKEKLIKKPLLPKEIYEITDIKAREGFKFDLLLPRYKLLHFETYNHLSWVTVRHYNNPIIKKCDELLKKKYPKNGANFFIVLEKE